MRNVSLLSGLVVAALAMLASPGWAQLHLAPGQTLADQVSRLEAEGWRSVGEGVMQRSLDAGPLETFAYGREGVAWVKAETEAQLYLLLDHHSNEPSSAVRGRVEGLRSALAHLEGMAPRLSAKDVAERAFACSAAFYAPADAHGTPTSRGVTGLATAYYFSLCLNQPARVWASAFASTIDGYASWGRSGAGQSAMVFGSATTPGGPDCYSEAYASVTVDALGFFYSAYDANFRCPASAPAVRITGPTSLSLTGTTCVTATWTAQASGGTGPYGYSWTIDGQPRGNTAALAQSYCGASAPSLDIDTIRVVVTDAAGEETSASSMLTVSRSPI
jgi:hypothetical protein